MANKIQFRRGTKAQLTALGPLAAGEPGYTSDTKELVIGNATGANTPVVTATSADITYYVRTDGNDANTGLANTAGGAFKTITKAISFIPQIVNHAVTVNVAAGTYAEIISLSGYSGGGSITIQGDTVASSSRTVQAIAIINNSLRIMLNGLNCNASNTNGVSISKSVYVEISYCNLIASAPTASGVDASASTVRVNGCAISNKGQAILSADGSRIHSDSNSGSGNTYALYVYQGPGLITQSGTQPSSTNGNGAATGLVLSNSVINPWGDNTFTSRSSFYAYLAPAATITKSVQTKVTFQNKVYDNKGDYSNSTGVFTAPKSGLYLVECSIVYGAAEPAVSHYLTIYKAGSSRELAAYAVSPPGGGDLQLSVSGTIYLNAGEYIAAYTIHGSSVDKSINADSALSRFKVLQIA